MPEWKHTSYIKKGLFHDTTGIECQDSVIVREDEYCIVAALADGLGSLENSAVASSAATDAVWTLFSALGKDKIILESEKRAQALAKSLVEGIVKKVKNEAESMGLSTASMDCTLVFVYISKLYDYAITGRLGDSAICVITEDNAIALSDSGKSANGTCAIFDKDAALHMELSFWDIPASRICGFILTSDGLDNEVYRKGSPYVNKAAETYFNAVLAADPQRVIEERIAELTAEQDTAFDDDISIAVVNQATKKVIFPGDPTWLCTCGARNRLQDTYCQECGQDFIKLYSHVRFREYGGKAAFFARLNATPYEEERLIGIQTAPKAAAEIATPTQDDAVLSFYTAAENIGQPEAPPKEAKAAKSAKTDIRKHLPFISTLGMLCIVAGFALASAVIPKESKKNIPDSPALSPDVSFSEGSAGLTTEPVLPEDDGALNDPEQTPGSPNSTSTDNGSLQSPQENTVDENQDDSKEKGQKPGELSKYEVIDNLDVWGVPNDQETLLDGLSEGEIVRRTEKESSPDESGIVWVEVTTYKDVVGWVKDSSIHEIGDTSLWMVKLSPDGLHVRNKPEDGEWGGYKFNENHEKIKLSNGDVVTRVGEETETTADKRIWYKIIYKDNGKERIGWVASYYLEQIDPKTDE